jgi:hypothetical protein
MMAPKQLDCFMDWNISCSLILSRNLSKGVGMKVFVFAIYVFLNSQLLLAQEGSPNRFRLGTIEIYCENSEIISQIKATYIDASKKLSSLSSQEIQEGFIGGYRKAVDINGIRYYLNKQSPVNQITMMADFQTAYDSLNEMTRATSNLLVNFSTERYLHGTFAGSFSSIDGPGLGQVLIQSSNKCSISKN